MADFGVYFWITNLTGSELTYSHSGLQDAVYDGPTVIFPGDGAIKVHLDDPFLDKGASGTVYFIANIKGQMREYAWYGSCPVVQSNSAHGPGITSWTGESGHPNYINITINEETPGWTPVGSAERVDIRAARAAAAGKKPSDPKKTVKYKQPKIKK